MYRLTLIIPTFNRARSLLRALDSVARQTLDPAVWECLIIDNASTDSTAAEVARFAAEHPELHLRLIREEQQGVSYARNRGLREASTEFICSIDDDERINPEFLEHYLRFFEDHPDAAVVGGRIIPEYEVERPRWMSSWTERPIANPIDLGTEIRPFPRGVLPGGGNMGFRRSVALQFGFATELGRTGGQLIGGEENDFFLRMAASGHTLWYLPDAVMWHIIPPEKLTEAYFRRLAYHNGISQRLRAELRGGVGRLRLNEVLKWGATLLLSLTMRAPQRRMLWVMRREIGRGIFPKNAPTTHKAGDRSAK